MHPSSAGERNLCRFAAAMAVSDRGAARRALDAARRARVPRAAIEETGLMLVLYAGYPAALEAMALIRERYPGSARRTREPGRLQWQRRGMRLCRQVYASAFPRLLRRVRTLHPDLAAWMIEEGYGRVLSRPGLDPRTRELVTVAALVATGWRRQLVSHLLGAQRLGASAANLRLAFDAGLDHADAAARIEARRAWREVEARGQPG